MCALRGHCALSSILSSHGRPEDRLICFDCPQARASRIRPNAALSFRWSSLGMLWLCFRMTLLQPGCCIMAQDSNSAVEHDRSHSWQIICAVLQRVQITDKCPECEPNHIDLQALIWAKVQVCASCLACEVETYVSAVDISLHMLQIRQHAFTHMLVLECTFVAVDMTAC
jgi:hypothetical protein